MGNPISLIAGGDIRPARIVKISTAADFTVLEADANERAYGIAIDAAQAAPIPGASAVAAGDGQSVMVYGPGDECTLEIGTGGIVRGGMIKSDADGKGVAAAATGTTVQWIAAEALESAAEGAKAKVRVCNFPFRPALT